MVGIVGMVGMYLISSLSITIYLIIFLQSYTINNHAYRIYVYK